MPGARYKTMTGKHRYVFEISTKTGRDYLFCASSMDDMDTWLTHIDDSVNLRKVSGENCCKLSGAKS